MKQTGIFRRVDELGRIVIPKEIRKSLKINDGESLEIFINDDAIILKKYSLMSDLYKVAQDCSDSFYDVLGMNMIITDRDKVIAASGALKKKYIDKELNKEISDLLSKRDVIIDNERNYIYVTTIEKEFCKYIISPVLSNGDAVGAVIILSNDNITELDKKSSNFVSKFLSKHLE